jgi:hypothetical protein
MAVIALCFAIFAYSMAEGTKPSEAGERRLKIWIGRLCLAVAAALGVTSLVLALVSK